MTTQTEHLIALWKESRARLENQLGDITAFDLKKKLAPSRNSLGYLLRHIAEVELLFAKNVFGAKDTKIIAKTIIAQHDTGEWTDLEKLILMLDNSRNTIINILQKQNSTDWDQEIETKEFGIKTKVQALGRIISHTAYHAGQIGIIIKYGTV
ncbi:damage-inducible protein DinB [Nonlabens arenilitoris]|uniref:Damage-inducible protein DinB n=2 Tax=Nonlabens arenilitoris TaxID=1217969 RepID=A0A2S7U7R4_9FLAO|nr:damage-inducible protein DinB [Nonlabens arenilitoris]